MKRTIASACMALIACTAVAQMPQDPTYGLTPNARSFQRYGDIPVSLYTGTPSISIPIDTINDGSLSLPISLSYHSGGIKADEHPGWVGLGWSLMLGGVITREVRDVPDESDKSEETGYFRNHNILNNSVYIDGNNPDAVADMIDNNVSALIHYDSEPDKFNFHFDGYSGFFMLDPKGNWQVHSNRPLKVKSATFGKHPVINGVRAEVDSRIFHTFILVGYDGTEYEFGNGSIDFYINFRHQSTLGWTASAWHMTKITATDGSVISFDYKRGDYVASISYCDEIIGISNAYGSSTTTVSPYHGSLMSPVYLVSVGGNTFSLKLHDSVSNELNYRKEYYEKLLYNLYDPPKFLNFDYNNDTDIQISKIKWYKLDSISFIDEKSHLYKLVRFGYINNASMRLAMERINIYYCPLNHKSESPTS
ncbi:hypothetical protein [uncultured Muribaculum sp.]|uniref:hypothetical protein n=1 Tax=uncultured Muribaculum sp. TaxID=1918613 RepID=UPI002615E3E3|nr:hypothetical protein [uncultured Muribaculum sp.]